MVEIEIDGKKVEVKSGSTVMQAAEQAGAYIPHFCYHKKLSLAASCRMCMVEVEKMPKPVPACVTPVMDGMVVHTGSKMAVDAQKAVMEFLLINHPLDCPICDQGGECQLQDIAVGYGAGTSRYQEEKRIVLRKDAGPLVAMEEMSRCIHCTRCVRFGQEIAGAMELGMLNRSDHAEISTFIGKTIDSELSGNMIDLCPVGALTSKPFRYQARSWELTRRKSISPHDGLGANLIVQTRQDRVMRVLPLENDALNECWLSDKDRFSYEALNSEERLTRPMIKQGGEWYETDWQGALDFIFHALKDVRDNLGADEIAALASPHATLEELALLQKLVRGLGSENVDFRLRQMEFALDGQVTPWLGMSIAEFGQLQDVFIVGSFLRKDHPLLAARLRQAAKTGATVSSLHAVDDDWLMPVSNKLVQAPSSWLGALGEVTAYIAQEKNISTPDGFESIMPSEAAKNIGKGLLAGRSSSILLGNAAVQHPQASQLHAACEWIVQQTGAKLGYLTEAANTVGGYLAGATSEGGAQSLLEKPRKAYLLLHTEPEYDAANPALAKAALDQAATVIVLSPFKHSMDVADVMLPIAPFTETSGTFVNCEGRVQSFNGVARPLGETRPGWKVLRVLANKLGLEGFDYDTSEQVRDEITQGETDLSARLNNVANRAPVVGSVEQMGLERIADVPIYFADPLVRRAPALQQTKDAQPPKAHMHPTLLEQLGLVEDETARISQGEGQAVLAVTADDGLAENVVRVAAGHSLTAGLGSMFGAIRVEKA